MLSGVRASVEQAARPLQPALGDAFFSAEGGTVPGEPDGDAGRGILIAAVTIGAEGALTRVEHDLAAIEPPRGEAEAFERLRDLLDRQDAFERPLCVRPRTCVQGHTTSSQIIDRLRGAHGSIISRRWSAGPKGPALLLGREPPDVGTGDYIDRSIRRLAQVADPSLAIGQQLLFGDDTVAVQHQTHQLMSVLRRHRSD